MAQQGNLFIEDLYAQIELELLANIGRLIGNGEGVTPEDVLNWQVEKLGQLGQLSELQMEILAKYADMTVEQMRAFIQEHAIVAIEEEQKLLDERTDGVLLYQEPTNQLYERLEVLDRQASNVMNQINSSLLERSEQLYRDILTKTSSQVLTGNKTVQQALKETATEWAQLGIPVMTDRAGRNWSVEGYARMVIRNTQKNVANEIQEGLMDDYEVDLVEASSHAGSRPSHIDYQGKVYSRSGRSKRYPALSETSYGQGADGFVTGIGCGHRLYVYVHGVSTKRYEPYDKAYSLQTYENSQKQRRLERDIRASKKELAMLEEMDMPPEEIAQAKEKVRKKQENMRHFIDETGRTRRRGREQIVSASKPKVAVEPERFRKLLVNEQKKKQSEQIKKRAIEKPKLLKAKEIDQLKGKKLREHARDIAIAYHESERTGNPYNERTTEQMVNSLLINQSESALREEIKAMQRRLRE
ncbi:phage minor capsid protein [Atopococcus tabaci]|uniref:phage minor capsid protein n=1 Tax=Atopococcus tabaci TaxID=269774 RepID=UPI002409238A|nr:phage minor capsid protein [Atopococcus tabaci]